MMSENQLHGKPSENELEMINKLAQRELTEDEVFVFSVTLCDNEVDRDFERFSIDSLKTLAEMFVGKTGILDHSQSAKDQSARIFSTEICTDSKRKNCSGEVYTYLKARAYMARTPGNAELISEIEAGIKKEVSVGCRIGEVICSVCGGNMNSLECEHMRGKKYGGKVCYGTLAQPTDAYEWSFVAVPAQREAGVTKAYDNREEKGLDNLDVIKSLTEDTVITVSDSKKLGDELRLLQAQAADGREYRAALVGQIQKYALLAAPKLMGLDLTGFCDGMSVKQLSVLRDALLAQANETMPVQPQLKTRSDAKAPANGSFKI